MILVKETLVLVVMTYEKEKEKVKKENTKKG